MSSRKYFATPVKLNETESVLCQSKGQLMKVLPSLALQQILGRVTVVLQHLRDLALRLIWPRSEKNAPISLISYLYQSEI